MPANDKLIKRDGAGQPVPQVFDPTTDEYQPAIGTAGRQHAIIYSATGAAIDMAALANDVVSAINDQASGTAASPIFVKAMGGGVEIEAVSVTSTAQSLNSLVTAVKSGRSFVEIQATTAVVVGGSGVTTSTGRSVANEAWRIPLSSDDDVYLITATTATAIITQG